MQIDKRKGAARDARPRPMRMERALALLAVILWMSSIPTAAAVLVSSAWELRNAVMNMPSELSIEVATGVYELPSPIPISRTVAIFAAQPDTVTLSGRGSNRIFELQLKADVTLSNLTFVDGKGEAAPTSTTSLPFSTPPGGGCIAAYTFTTSPINSASKLVMENVQFRRCTTITGSGGAVLLFLPSASMFRCSNCTFEDNSALNSVTGSGGAVHFEMYQGSGPYALGFRIESSLFRNNSARVGGAVAVLAAAQEVRLDAVEFINNSATVSGGALLMLEDVSVSRTWFKGNQASGQGNAVDIPTGPILSIDNMTVFTCNGGFDGVPNFPNPTVIKRATQDQVRVVVFTPRPTPAPFTTSPPNPTAPPVTLPPSALRPTAAPEASNDFTPVGVGIALGLLVMVMSLLFVVARKRREDSRAAMANQQRAEEAQHTAFAHRRKRPKVVSFTELLPMEIADAPCSICGEPRVDASTVNRCLGTISANKYKINSIPALTATYAKVECGHLYHAACLIVWTEVNDRSSCPTCRHEIAFEGNRRASSFNSSDSDKPGSGRGSMVGADPSAATIDNTQMVISVPADLPFSHEARRSANNDDQLAEQNAILVRELDTLQSRRTGGGSSTRQGGA